MRELTANDVEFTITHFPDDVSIEGNAGDEQDEKWVKDQLRRGNDWAWCVVKVSAHWHDWEGSDQIGACSYRSEKEFCNGGYYEDMQERALIDLNEQLESAKRQLAELD